MKIVRNLAFLIFCGLPMALSANEVVNINTANREMLMSLHGIGEKFADAIINYREENGGFASLQELANVRGIGQSTIDKNQDVLTVGDAD